MIGPGHERRRRRRGVAVLLALGVALVVVLSVLAFGLSPLVTNPLVDVAPPTISGVAATAITSWGATLTWTTDEAADTRAEYGTTAAYGNASSLGPTLATGHTVRLDGLSAGTVYHYRVMSRDGAGNLAASGDFTFTTAPLGSPGPKRGIWIGLTEIAVLPASGPAWDNLRSQADQPCGVPDLANQDDLANVCVLAKALVFARTGGTSYRDGVIAALQAVTSSGTYAGRALALGRELAAYVIAADLIDLETLDPTLDASFRAKLAELRTTPTTGGPTSLIECHEVRPNNWGTHCGASRAAVAAYLNDTVELARVAQVFRGWLGDRSTYAGFSYGDLSWQCEPAAPVGINPKGCTIQGHSVDGVLPDDQRRSGGFTWPPPQENYVYEALQGALVQAVLLYRAGYDSFAWQDQALLRAFQWLHAEANFPAAGDDTWQPHLVNHFYGASFPAPVPASPGKNVGWTDFTHPPGP